MFYLHVSMGDRHILMIDINIAARDPKKNQNLGDDRLYLLNPKKVV